MTAILFPCHLLCLALSLFIIVVGGHPSKKDVFFWNYCHDIPGHYRLDALAFYEPNPRTGDGILGVFLNSFYWEMKTRHDGYPIITRGPMRTNTYFLPLDPDPTQESEYPLIESAVHFRGRLYIVLLLNRDVSAGQLKRQLYQFDYNPAVHDRKPRLITEPVRPEEVFGMLSWQWMDQGVGALFTTPDLDDFDERILWVNLLGKEYRSLYAYAMQRITLGGRPSSIWDLEAAGEGSRNRSEIWAMDIYRYDRAAREVFLYNFKKIAYFAVQRRVDTSPTYVLTYKLAKDAESWSVRRLPGELLDSNVMTGCPPSLCFDTTMDTIFARQAAAGNDSWTFYIFRGQFYYKVKSKTAFQVPYPRTALTFRSLNFNFDQTYDSSTDSSDVFSLRDLFSGHPQMKGHLGYMFDGSLMLTPSTDPTLQKVILFANRQYFVIDMRDRDGDKLLTKVTTSGPIKDMFLRVGVAYPEIIDAAWQNPISGKVHFYSGTLSWSCEAVFKPDPRFVRCSDPNSARPRGFRDKISAIMVHTQSSYDHLGFARHQQPVSFFSGNFWWNVTMLDEEDRWLEANYTPQMVHDVQVDGSGFFRIERPYNTCPYEDYSENAYNRTATWQFLESFLRDPTVKVYRPESIGDRQGPSDARILITGTLVFLACVAIIVMAVVFWLYRRKKRQDETTTSETFSTIVSIRSQIRAVSQLDKNK